MSNAAVFHFYQKLTFNLNIFCKCVSGGLTDVEEGKENGKSDAAQVEPCRKEGRSRSSNTDEQTSTSVHWQTQARQNQPSLTTLLVA